MRKKAFLLVLITMMTLFGAACNGDENGIEEPAETEDETTVEDDETVDEADEDSIAVEENMFDVEITLPASLVEDVDPEEMIAEAEEEGIGDVVVNDDGSVTYTMSREKHNELLQELKEGTHETIEEIKASDDYVSIVDIRANDDLSEFTIVVVDQETYENSFDGFAAFGLGINGMFYQLFQGVDPDDYEVIIHVEEEESGEVFNTINYPDDFEEVE
ncbi:hypothetical protein LGQ02_05735 [Bacillus shivajii]|uniref:hypothetical protein n=1 Tax=Bacillus shivajii TaxID=1983719 RepID=UPI001CFB2B15|nr:hypothetical protein [Bacillus shivajii]UCZ54263.1 hypothetical protein LGQ02_05735 [Bacillus shivajii]